MQTASGKFRGRRRQLPLARGRAASAVGMFLRSPACADEPRLISDLSRCPGTPFSHGSTQAARSRAGDPRSGHVSGSSLASGITRTSRSSDIRLTGTVKLTNWRPPLTLPLLPCTCGAAQGCARAMHLWSEHPGGGVGTRYTACLLRGGGQSSSTPWYGN